MRDKPTIVHLYGAVDSHPSNAEIVELAEAWIAGERDHRQLSIQTGIKLNMIARSLRSKLFTETIQSMVRAKALIALDHSVESADLDQRSEDPKIRSVARDFLLKAASKNVSTSEQEKEDSNWDPADDERLQDQARRILDSRILSPGGDRKEAAH